MREYHVRICEGLGVKFPGLLGFFNRLARSRSTAAYPVIGPVPGSSSDVALPAGALSLPPLRPRQIGPNAGGGMRRLAAFSYADAIFNSTSSLPGSARNTSENGRPGGGMCVGVCDGFDI
jgi:hypothetical protein